MNTNLTHSHQLTGFKLTSFKDVIEQQWECKSAILEGSCDNLFSEYSNFVKGVIGSEDFDLPEDEDDKKKFEGKDTELQIFIKTLSGKTIALDVKNRETIKHIKAKIENKEGTPSTLQKLWFTGKVLRDEMSIKESNITKNATLHLLLGLKGGMEMDEDELDRKMLCRRSSKDKLLQLRSKLGHAEISTEELNRTMVSYNECYIEVLKDFESMAINAKRLKKKEYSSIIDKELTKLEDQNEEVLAAAKQRFNINHKQIKEEERVQMVEDKIPIKFQPVTLPKFSGNVGEYEKWKRTFEACVNSSKMSDIAKQIMLDQCLIGEPKALIKNIDITQESYKTILAKLDKRYGGAQRQNANLMREINEFFPVRANNLKDLEFFVGLLEAIISRSK